MIPYTLPTGTRRQFPWKDSSRTMRVPLWTASPEGETLLGLIKVPVRLVGTAQHTNERLEFEAFLSKQLARWIEWRGKRGYMLTTRPKITGPFDPQGDGSHDTKSQMDRATEMLGSNGGVKPITEYDRPEEVKWYWAQARFKLTNPIYARLDDILYLKELAALNDVDPSEDALPWNDPGEISVSGGSNIMEDAEARRVASGKKREDYLFGPLENPI